MMVGRTAQFGWRHLVCLATVASAASGCSHLLPAGATLIPSSPATLNACIDLNKFRHFLVDHHLVHNEMTPEIRARLAENIARRLDPDRILFTSADLHWFEEKVEAQEKAVWNTNCAAIESLDSLAKERAKANIATVAFQLRSQADGNYMDAGFRSSPALAKDEKQRQEHLKSYVWSLSEALKKAGVATDDVKALVLEDFTLQSKLIGRLSARALIDIYAKSMGHAFDANSSVVSARDIARVKGGGEYGFGVMLTSPGGLALVDRVFSQSPLAESSDVQWGDLVLALENEDVPAEHLPFRPLPWVINEMRGAQGSSVRLWLWKKNERKIVELSVDRRIALVNEESGTLPKYADTLRVIGKKSAKVGYLGVPRLFVRDDKISSHQLVEQMIERQVSNGALAFVLDLRYCSGGPISEVTQLISVFAGKVAAYGIKTREKDYEVVQSTVEAKFKGPIVVLVNAATASGAELVAGSLQKYGRAILVGEEATSGSGDVQVVYQGLDHLFKVTTGLLYLPDGTPLQGHRLRPDVLVGKGSQFEGLTQDGVLSAKPVASFMTKVKFDSKLTKARRARSVSASVSEESPIELAFRIAAALVED